MVVEMPDYSIAGYIIYTLEKRHISIVRMAIRPDVRRQGLGRMVLAKIDHKILQQRRDSASFLVHEADLSAHLFLKACGWMAESISRNHFDDGDAYNFIRVRQEPEFIS
jgi:ribosomal-protein-alanine N-acetyltransferase